MKPYIMAHRGASNLAQENTLEAFKKAVEINADIIELDVRKTADGILAVIHDAIIADKQVAGLNFKELNRLTALQNFNVPSLEQALGVVGNLHVQIEIKELGYEFETVETALKILQPPQFTIISFKFKCLEKIRTKFPQVKLALIIDSQPFALVSFLLLRRRYFKILDAFSLNWKLLDSKLGFLIPQKFPITIWNLDDPNSIKKFLKHPRVFALGTNSPYLALKLRENYAQPQ